MHTECSTSTSGKELGYIWEGKNTKDDKEFSGDEKVCKKVDY